MRTRTTRAAAGLLIVAALGGAAACSSDSSTTTEGTAKPAGTTAGTPLEMIVVRDAWCRESPAMAEAAACYATITNNSGEDDGLVSVSVPSDVAAEAQLHETVMGSGTGTTMAGSEGTTMGSDHMGSDDMNTAGFAGDDMTTGSDMSSDMTEGTTMGTSMGSDMMTMQEVDEIEVPNGETVKLEPGGYHIMLMQLVKPLEKGQTIELTLDFHETGPQTVAFEVRSA